MSTGFTEFRDVYLWLFSSSDSVIIHIYQTKRKRINKFYVILSENLSRIFKYPFLRLFPVQINKSFCLNCFHFLKQRLGNFILIIYSIVSKVIVKTSFITANVPYRFHGYYFNILRVIGKHCIFIELSAGYIKPCRRLEP